MSFCYRHLKQLGLGGEDSSFLRLTIGLAILAVGGIYAFRFFSNMRYLLFLSLDIKFNFCLFPDELEGVHWDTNVVNSKHSAVLVAIVFLLVFIL